MYTEFYGLKELPFALTPDPRYIYFTPSHTEVMANLHYGIESGKGLIVVTGEVGTGKTTMLRWMMQRLDRTVMVAYIFNPRLSVPEFYQHLATLFDIQKWETKSDLLIELGKVLESRHSRGLRTVLVVDEAHGLSPNVLEEIRLLCNFESDTAKQLQIVLTGQPELRDVLNYPDLRQLKQRVALRCEIKRAAQCRRDCAVHHFAAEDCRRGSPGHLFARRSRLHLSLLGRDSAQHQQSLRQRPAEWLRRRANRSSAAQ